jgi:hypothetical protein
MSPVLPRSSGTVMFAIDRAGSSTTLLAMGAPPRPAPEPAQAPPRPAPEPAQALPPQAGIGTPAPGSPTALLYEPLPRPPPPRPGPGSWGVRLTMRVNDPEIPPGHSAVPAASAPSKPRVQNRFPVSLSIAKT